MFCQSCGMAVDLEDNFCTRCGRGFVAVPQVERGPVGGPYLAATHQLTPQPSVVQGPRMPRAGAVGIVLRRSLKRLLIVLAIVAVAAIGIFAIIIHIDFRNNDTIYDWKGRAIVVANVPGDPTEHISWVNTAPFPPDVPVLRNLPNTLTPVYPACPHDDAGVRDGTASRTCSIIGIHQDGSIQFFNFAEREYPGSSTWPGLAYPGPPERWVYAARVPELVSGRIGKEYVFDSRVESATLPSPSAMAPAGFLAQSSSGLLGALPLTVGQARRQFPPELAVSEDNDDLEVYAVGRMVSAYGSPSITNYPTYGAIVCSKKQVKCVEAETFVPRPTGEWSAILVDDNSLARAPVRGDPFSQMVSAGSTLTTFSISSWSSTSRGFSIVAMVQNKDCGDVSLSIDTATRSIDENVKQTCDSNLPEEYPSFMLGDSGDASQESLLLVPILDEDRVSQERDYCGRQFSYGNDHIDSARVFGSISNENEATAPRWEEFASSEALQKKVDSAVNVGETDTAYAVTRDSSVVFIRTFLEDDTGDFLHQVDYCFRSDGAIAEARSDLTWIPMNEREEREIFFSEHGDDIGSTVNYVELGNNRLARLPERPKDFPERSFPIYRRVSDLPFLKLDVNH